MPAVQEVHIAIAPDGGYAWIILIAAFVSNIVVDGIAFSFSTALLPNLSEVLNVPTSKIAVINSAQLGTYYLFGPIACAIVNHYGFRAVGICGSVIAFVGIFVASHIPSFPVILALYGVIAGIGFGMIYTATVISVGYYFEKYRALSSAISLCGSSFGALCLPPLFALIVAEKGWDFTMKIQSCSVFVCLFCSFVYRPLKAITRVPLTQDIINEIDQLRSPSRVEFVELYKTDSMVSIDLDDPSVESTHFPQISIISSRFLPIPTIKTEKPKRCSWLRNLCSTKTTPGNKMLNVVSTGPLDRKDIFYSASVLQLPEYRNVMTENSEDKGRLNLSYHLSMILDPKTIQLSKSVVNSPNRAFDEDTPYYFGISHLIQKALRKLFDVSLLKSVVFCVLCAACLCYSLAWMTPYIYLPKRGEMNGIRQSDTRWFVSTISIGNMIGRISSGVVFTVFPNLNEIYFVGVATLTAGIITIISAITGLDDVNVQFCYCIVFGFSIAFVNVLRPVIFVKLLGLDKLTNAIGLSSAVIGAGVLAGTPIASILFENTNSFMWTFVLCGSLYIVCGLLIILAFHIHLRQKK